MLSSSDSVRGCRINEVNLIAAGLKTCQDAFRKCRKYEDASISTIATCSVDTEQTKIKVSFGPEENNFYLIKNLISRLHRLTRT